jgi:hypothetical protein
VPRPLNKFTAVKNEPPQSRRIESPDEQDHLFGGSRVWLKIPNNWLMTGVIPPPTNESIYVAAHGAARPWAGGIEVAKVNFPLCLEPNAWFGVGRVRWWGARLPAALPPQS